MTRQFWGFLQGAAGLLLEEEIRQAVSGTVGTASGAAAIGLALTIVLPSTSEDLLALAIAVLVSYVGILNLPLKRSEAKSKVRRAATRFSEEVEAAMEAEATAALDGTLERVFAAMKPWEAAAAKDVARIEGELVQQEQLVKQLKELQQRIRRS
jgi:hypothetical protein